MAKRKAAAAPETEKEAAKVTENKFSKKAKSLFADYPTVEQFYFTSDGTAFFKECDAKNHGKSLKDTSVSTIKKG